MMKLKVMMKQMIIMKLTIAIRKNLGTPNRC